MPLEPYRRGATWWAKGRIEINGRPVSDYIRESTGSSDERGARDWIREREAQEERRFFVGEESRELTFNDAVLLYSPTKDMGKYLIPIVREFGNLPVTRITAQMVKDLARKLYPKNSTDSWRRWVITPARAVINHAHSLGKCPPIRIKGFERAEMVRQDKFRGTRSRVAKTPGSWEWLLKFRQTAPRHHAALALFMFATGARISQAVAMHPNDLDLKNGKATIPGAKGHDDRTVTLPPEVVQELKALPPKVPRGWKKAPANERVFGFASKDGPRKAWISSCKKAGIAYLPPHSAGRHGFGQEMRVRQGVDKKAVGAFGGWSDTELLDRTYTHEEQSEDKILEAFRTGRVQAEISTGLKLAEDVGISA